MPQRKMPYGRSSASTRRRPDRPKAVRNSRPVSPEETSRKSISSSRSSGLWTWHNSLPRLRYPVAHVADMRMSRMQCRTSPGMHTFPIGTPTVTILSPPSGTPRGKDTEKTAKTEPDNRRPPDYCGGAARCPPTQHRPGSSGSISGRGVGVTKKIFRFV